MILRLLIVILITIGIIFIPYGIGRYFNTDKDEYFIFYWVAGILFFIVLTFIIAVLLLFTELFNNIVIYWVINGHL